jgi:hypothetical protein
MPGFLGEDLADDDLVLRLRLHLGRGFLAARRGLDERVDARHRNRLAIDGGDVLRHHGERQREDADEGGRGFEIHAGRLSNKRFWT